MCDEVLEALAIRENGIYIDCTYGRGGHTAAILRRLSDEGRVLAIDKDRQAAASGEQHAREDERLEMIHGDFDAIGRLAGLRNLVGKVDGIVFDLGVSSPQLDDPDRGFSFMREGPLDMRMDTTKGEPASAWLARARESEIKRVLREYGEERFAGRIARAIVRARDEAPIMTTRQLAEIVRRSQPKSDPGQHPATRSFLAIRIHLNEELTRLGRALDGAVPVLRPGGRLVVLSFHSLEDRIVKRFMRSASRETVIHPEMPVAPERFEPRLRVLGKPRRPGAEECRLNPRARSALMRVAEKLPVCKS